MRVERCGRDGIHASEANERARRDLNPRHLGPEPSALSAELRALTAAYPRRAFNASDSGYFVAASRPEIGPRDREHVFQTGFTTREDATSYGLDTVREVVESRGRTVDACPNRTDVEAPAGVSVPEGACFAVRAPGSEAVEASAPWVDR